MRRYFLLLVGVLLAALLGYWLAGTARPVPAVVKSTAPAPAPPKLVPQEPPLKYRVADRPPASGRDLEAAQAGALEGQRVLVFANQAALEAFLKRAGNRVAVLGRLDALNALRIGFSDGLDFASLLTGNEESSFIFPAQIPEPKNGVVQPGAVGLGAELLAWLGISGDNSTAGKGVRIAVLDTGVAAHPAFRSQISTLDLVPLPADLAQQNGHGTSVASMILGNDALTPGIAPSATMLSIRIADDAGRSDTFLIAEGILAAVKSGVNLINISLGGFGDSALVRNAVDVARQAGVVIIAPTGNNGINQISYPAAYPGVIAVGGVDALGNHLAFSNTGTQTKTAAPGYAVNAATTGGKAVSVSGTSFSSPIVAGAIAYVKSLPGNERLTTQQAADLTFSYFNEGGAPGPDPEFGSGMIDLSRVKNGKTRGIYDAAIATQRILPPSANAPYGQVEITVQNRGTEPLINTNVQLTTPNGNSNWNITSLPIGGTSTTRVPITFKTATSLRYESKVSLSGGRRDIKPSNDRRAETYVPTTR